MDVPCDMTIFAKRRHLCGTHQFECRRSLALCVLLASLGALSIEKLLAFSFDPCGSPRICGGLACSFGVKQRILHKLSPAAHYLLTRGPTVVASQSGSLSASEEAKPALLAPKRLYVAKVCAAAFVPGMVRYIVDILRGAVPALLSNWQFAFASMWALNTLAIAVPGRFDGSSKTTLEDGSPVVRFFTPAGWAFAIWAPIFLGEWLAMVYVTSLAVPGHGGATASGITSMMASSRLISSVAPGWCCAIFAQVAWCATFRPEIGARNLWISTAFLGATAIFLGGVHHSLCAIAEDGALNTVSNVVVRIPIALHFGWITCATLVNLNKWLSLNGSNTTVKLAVAYSSVLVAVVAAAFVSITTRDPIFAFVVTWALFAVAMEAKVDGTPSRLRVSTLSGSSVALLTMLACVACKFL